MKIRSALGNVTKRVSFGVEKRACCTFLLISGLLVLPSASSSGVLLLAEIKLTAGDAAGGDRFGVSVAIDGDTVLVGAEHAAAVGSSSGAGYVFVRNGTTWSEEAKLQADGGLQVNILGNDVALDGDTAVLSANHDGGAGPASGAVFVFVRSGTTWSEQAILTASDGAPGDLFGSSVAVDGDTIVVAASRDDDAGSDTGSAYVFVRSGTTWSEQAKLVASDAAANDFFGDTVSIDGDTVAIGSTGDDTQGPWTGAVYVFVRSGTTWSEQAKLVASDAVADGSFGYPVSIHGDTVAIGSPYGSGAAAYSGAAYVFVRSGTSWSEEAKLTASDGASDDLFGEAVSLHGDIIVVGAEGDDDAGGDSGSAYVFLRNAGTWTEHTKLTAGDGAAGDAFGYWVSNDANNAVVAAWLDDGVALNSGSAYLFDLSSLTPGGVGVPLNPVDTTTGDSPVSLTFDAVTAPGTTTLNTSETGPSPPAGFQVSDPPFYFDLSTTATFAGSVTVCVDYSGMPAFTSLTEAEQLALSLFHYEAGAWADHTVRPVDTANQMLCANVTSFSLFAVFLEQVIEVAVDIKPNEEPNSINLGSNGTVPVAILSTSEFDATTVDPTSVTLAGATVQLRGKGKPMASSSDVNLDGFTDLVVHVDTEAFQLSQGDTVAILEGETTAGIKIVGSDTVRIVPQDGQ